MLAFCLSFVLSKPFLLLLYMYSVNTCTVQPLFSLYTCLLPSFVSSLLFPTYVTSLVLWWAWRFMAEPQGINFMIVQFSNVITDRYSKLPSVEMIATCLWRSSTQVEVKPYLPITYLNIAQTPFLPIFPGVCLEEDILAELEAFSITGSTSKGLRRRARASSSLTRRTRFSSSTFIMQARRGSASSCYVSQIKNHTSHVLHLRRYVFVAAHRSCLFSISLLKFQIRSVAAAKSVGSPSTNSLPCQSFCVQHILLRIHHNQTLRRRSSSSCVSDSEVRTHGEDVYSGDLADDG